MMRIVVTGKSGQLVTALLERSTLQGLELVTVGRPELDLADATGNMAALVAARPDVIVSAAAYTAVDKAESEPDLALSINGIAAGHVAQCAERLGVPIIHVSTDYVFSGKKVAPYVELDPPDPLGVYGRTKLAGEIAVASATPNHVILRTAWVYSPFGNNFLKTMLRLSRERQNLRVVGDQYGNPTSALDLADAILSIASNLAIRPDEKGLRGVFHAVGQGRASWSEFAMEILAASKALGGPWANVTSIPSCEYPTPAKRPTNSELSTELLAVVHGIQFPDWRDSTRATVRRLLP